MGWGMRVIVIALAVALAIVLASPHIALLKPIAQRLGLVTTVTQTIYVPVNHTVYVNRTVYVNQTIVRYINQTVPVYINRTVYVPVSSYFESYAGYCSGRLVFLPNDTAWIVWFWLMPKAYFKISPYLYLYYLHGYVQYYNSTNHYAQFAPFIASYFISPQGLSIFGWGGACYVDNVTINREYYILACGDTEGIGPLMFTQDGDVHIVWNGTTAYEELQIISDTVYITNNFSNIIRGVYGSYYIRMPIPVVNATYRGIMFMEYVPTFPNFIITPGPLCDLTITFVRNATDALWLPVTTNQTLVNYWRYADKLAFGNYDPYDNTMGYWVWNYPS